MVFFDLPMTTSTDVRNYSRFHKFLLKNGFIMLQKSVYSKLVINNMTSAAVRKKVRQNVPKQGVITLLEITENQFSSMEYLIGDAPHLVLDSMDRIVEI